MIMKMNKMIIITIIMNNDNENEQNDYNIMNNNLIFYLK
jgi:hypothetical protein